MADIVHTFCERSVNSNVLDEIVAAHRRAAAEDTRTLDELERAALAARPVRPFRAALAAPGIGVIAEIKRRSPSKGDLAPDLVPAVLAKAYADGGADCLSVLTDVDFFGGSADDLAEARQACDLPVLRKDFTVSEADVYDARAMGADAVLLIVAALSQAELSAFRLLADELGMAALVEVHDVDELRRALDAGAKLVGVNQRDLRTFEVDPARAERLAEAMPPGVVKVAESGIRDAAEVARLAACGYDAVLVGESLVTSGDPAAAVRMLKGAR
jgi:indole-3-glycerol phosphate synthase